MTALNVVQAFAAVMDDVRKVTKDGRNTAQNFNFRGIDGVMNAVGPALRKHGVVIVPKVLHTNYRDIEVGKNRTLMREVTVEVGYTIHGPNGDTIEGSAPGESMDSGDKGTAKAMSVAYRTFLLQALTIPTDEPDPDEHSYERAPAAKPEPAKPTVLDGFLDADDQQTQHDDLAETIKASSPEVRDHMKAWRNDQRLPWPMKRDDLERMWQELAEAQKPKDDERPFEHDDPLPSPEANELVAKANRIRAEKARAAS